VREWGNVRVHFSFDPACSCIQCPSLSNPDSPRLLHQRIFSLSSSWGASDTLHSWLNRTNLAVMSSNVESVRFVCIAVRIHMPIPQIFISPSRVSSREGEKGRNEQFSFQPLFSYHLLCLLCLRFTLLSQMVWAHRISGGSVRNRLDGWGESDWGRLKEEWRRGNRSCRLMRAFRWGEEARGEEGGNRDITLQAWTRDEVSTGEDRADRVEQVPWAYLDLVRRKLRLLR